MESEFVRIHTLANGATVIMISPGHGFKFSDSTECGPQEKTICDLFNLERKLQKKGEIKGMALNQISMTLSKDQIQGLTILATMADLVIIPFPVLTALREQGIRDQFPNCVAFNATEETMRSAPQDKVIDINNWSY